MFILKGGEFYRLVIVHYSRLRGHFAYATLLLKLKTCELEFGLRTKIGQKAVTEYRYLILYTT